MGQIKILFLITQSELGGAQRWVFDVATNLDKNRFAVVVAAGDKLDSTSSIGLVNKLEKAGIHTRQLYYLVRNINPLKDLLAIVEIYRIIKKERPDILQLCSTKAGFLGAIAGRLAGCQKIIYRIGGWSFNDPRPAWQNFIFLWLEKLSAPLKDKIIVNSQNGYDEALNYKICSSKKLILIYNGIKTPTAMLYHSSNKNSKSGKLVVGAIANFYPTKGLRYLIEAAHILSFRFQVSGFRFYVVGDGQERPFLESLIKKYQLENNVFLVGQKENPWDYLLKEGIDIFVIPSVKEGVPYVLLEAMNWGLPIIATDVGGIPEIIKDRENGILIPPKNPNASAEAMKNLINDSKLRNNLSISALKYVQQFNIQEMLNKYEQLLYSSIRDR